MVVHSAAAWSTMPRVGVRPQMLGGRAPSCPSVHSAAAWSCIPEVGCREKTIGGRAQSRPSSPFSTGRREARGVVSLAMSAIGSQVEAWQGLWTSADGDVDMATVADSAVEGDLVGTLYRAGPGN